MIPIFAKPTLALRHLNIPNLYSSRNEKNIDTFNESDIYSIFNRITENNPYNEYFYMI